jgi:hypothetical protein
MSSLGDADLLAGMRPGKGDTWLCALIAAFMISLAFHAGRDATLGLTWGPYVDQDRDASFAESVLEGHYGEDPLYKGESMWFTPLMFTFEAYASKLSGLSIQLIQARAGAYLNLLVPIAFFLMAWRFFGPVVGLVALLAHLYLIPGQEPGWAVSTYSPWLLPMCFWQALFYLVLIVLLKAFASTSWKIWALTGLMAGILFLGHAAPAILVVAMIVIHVVSRTIVRARARDIAGAEQAMGLGLMAGAIFIVVTLPLTWFVVGDYMLDEKNRVPSAFTYRPLSLRNGNLFIFHNLSWFNAFAVTGLSLLFRSRASVQRRLLMLWLSITIFFTLYAYAAVTLSEYDIKLPMSVPAFHFYFYLKGALAVGFGVVVVEVLRRAVGLSSGALHGSANTSRTALASAGVVVFLVAAVYPSYAHRSDLAIVRTRCLVRMADTSATDMYSYLVHNVPWEAVVLCDEELSTAVVMASARKTVATSSSMANPYVAPGPRQAAREAMLQALEHPAPEMEGLLDEYEVTHLLVREADVGRMPEIPRWFPRTAYADAGYVLFSRK